MRKRKWNGYLIAGAIITTIIVVWILVGRFYTPYPPTKMSSAKLQGPSLAHLFGWRIPGTGEPGGLPFMGSHRVGHD